MSEDLGGVFLPSTAVLGVTAAVFTTRLFWRWALPPEMSGGQ